MSPTAGHAQYDQETEVTQGDDGRWHGHLSPRWNIGENPNGGYLLACALNAMARSVDHPDPLTVTTHFLRPGSPDAPFDVDVQVLRSGRSVSTVRATLAQQDKVRVEMLATFGDLEQNAGIDTELDPRPTYTLPPPPDCPLRSGQTQGLHLPIMDRLEVRLNPDHARAGESEDAVISGWIQFADGRAPDSLSLAMFADAFPPSLLTRLGVIGWVPTLELTVQVRRRPAPGWIQAEFHTADLQGGRMIESGMLWDQAGHLVAQSRQLGLVMRRDN